MWVRGRDCGCVIRGLLIATTGSQDERKYDNKGKETRSYAGPSDHSPVQFTSERSNIGPWVQTILRPEWVATAQP